MKRQTENIGEHVAANTKQDANADKTETSAGDDTAGHDGVDRRDFIKAGAAVAGAVAMAPMLPARARTPRVPRRGSRGKKLLVIFQFGGADALSEVAPFGDATYRNVLRPNLRVGAPGEGTALDGLPLDGTFAMYPTMSALHNFFVPGPGRLAIVHACGYPMSNRSHFVSQDIYQKGVLDDILFADGWLNRYAALTASSSDPAVRMLAFGRRSAPTSFRGAYPNFAIQGLDDLEIAARTGNIRNTLRNVVRTNWPDLKTSPLTGLRAGARGAFDLVELFDGVNETNFPPNVAYPMSDLGTQLKEIAITVKADLGVEVFHAQTGGWDHHSNIGGVLPGLAQDLSDSIAAFITDLGPAQAQDLAIVVMSEFGREAGENGSAGFDHGHGSAMFVMGGATVGGQIHGNWPGVGLSDLDSGRFLHPDNDFRNVLGDVLVGHMGVSPSDVEEVFDDFTYGPIGVM